MTKSDGSLSAFEVILRQKDVDLEIQTKMKELMNKQTNKQMIEWKNKQMDED